MPGYQTEMAMLSESNIFLLIFCIQVVKPFMTCAKALPFDKIDHFVFNFQKLCLDKV